MFTPSLTFNLFRAETKETLSICTMQLEYFPQDKEIQLYGYDFDRRGNWFSIPTETINAREYAVNILNGNDKNSFIYSFAKVIAENNEISHNDHLIAEFSGYGDCTGWSYVICLGNYIKNVETTKDNIIDDYELLMKKFNELQI